MSSCAGAVAGLRGTEAGAEVEFIFRRLVTLVSLRATVVEGTPESRIDETVFNSTGLNVVSGMTTTGAISIAVEGGEETVGVSEDMRGRLVLVVVCSVVETVAELDSESWGTMNCRNSVAVAAKGSDCDTAAASASSCAVT